VNHGGEGAFLFDVSYEGGIDQMRGSEFEMELPIVSLARDQDQIVQAPDAPPPNTRRPEDDDIHHRMGWLTAMRARIEPGATVHNGFSHAIVIIMTAQSYRTGKKLYWDPENKQTLDRPLV